MHRHPHRWLAAALLLLSVPLLSGSGTAGARVSRERAGPAVSPPAGRCPGWHVIPSPNPNPTPGTFNILYGVTAISPTAAWAVGQTNGAALIEHWTGQSWTVVPDLYPHRTAVVNAVSAVAANDVWAVGAYATANGRAQPPLTLHWNGSAWTVVPAPRVGQGDELYGVAALSATDAWAVGSVGVDAGTLIEHWNGTNWQVVPSPSPGSFAGLAAVVALAPTNVWAVGGGATGTLTEHWNGTSWQVVPSPNPPGGGGLNAVTAVPGTDQLWAVGNYTAAPLAAATLIEQWTGTAWQIVPSPNVGTDINYLFGVAAASASDAWTVGTAYNQGSNQSQPLLERWEGQQWQVAAGPTPGAFYNRLQAVTVIPGTHSLWAVGAEAQSGLGSTNPLTELYC
jgi:hypothetical protein